MSSRCPSELGLSSTSSVKVEEVEEGSEPAEFRNALGQQDKKAYDCMLQGASSHSHTTQVNCRKEGARSLLTTSAQ